ncbi:MAG: hypothetical protein RMX96_16600 [Nostoc sp. ChiSLP02]|nr:hypothetical protein [Nostoc sp. DedSLP05]MDZ8100561.1 hypothetical protein [Nostoc sp. DedSLP01]MDZ8186456.1 hypothetical protein [Nostoc sp. ChiSLP02]
MTQIEGKSGYIRAGEMAIFDESSERTIFSCDRYLDRSILILQREGKKAK